MKKLLISILLILFITQSKSQCLQADMMILIDWSRSELGYEKELATAAALFAYDLPVSEQQLRMGLLTFSDRINDVVELTGDKQYLIEEIVSISSREANGQTYINEAVDLASKYLINERMVPKIIIIISDGEIYDVEKSLQSLSISKSIIPLSVFAIQIGRPGLEEELSNLILLTGNPDNVEISVPSGILEALKKLDFCN